MKRKLLKQVIRQWPSNLWLVIELVIIGVVTWFLVDLLCQVYIPMLEPRGFDIGHCYKLTLAVSDSEDADSAMSEADMRRELISRLRHYPGVEGVALSRGGVEPYSGSLQARGITDVTTTDSVSYGMTDAGMIRYGYVNPDYFKVFRIAGPRGESPDSLASLMAPGGARMVLSANFAVRIDSGRPVPEPYSLIGHRFNMGYDYVLVGIVNDQKRNDIIPAGAYGTAFLPLEESNDDHISLVGAFTDCTIRVSPAADKDFMDRIRKDMPRLLRVGDIYVANVTPFGKIREASQASEFKTVDKMYIIIGFLLVNLFLGLLGTFWYRTRRRTPELAVRMSFGASRLSLFRRMLGESLILLGAAAVVAAGIIWLLLNAEVRPNITYMTAIEPSWIIRDSVITILVMLLTVSLGVLIPARAAMKVNPATALKDE